MDTDKIKGIIFDYGGTIDTNGIHWAEVLWSLYREHGVPVDRDVFRQAYVYGERTLAVNRIIVPEDDFRNVLLKKLHLQMNFLKDYGFIDVSADTSEWESAIADGGNSLAERCAKSAHLMFQKLHLKYKLTLVSNFYGNIKKVLDNFSLLCDFEHIVESSVVGIRKPDPAIFALGVELMHLKPEETVVVGDSVDKDMIPARLAGCRTVWLKGKAWDESISGEAHADAVITDLNELNEIFNI